MLAAADTNLVYAACFKGTKVLALGCQAQQQGMPMPASKSLEEKLSELSLAAASLLRLPSYA